MKTYLGIDVGGTKILAVATDERGRVLSQTVVRTPHTKLKFFSALEEIIRAAAIRRRLSGIGAGLPGAVDAARGKLFNAGNVGPFLRRWRARAFFRRFSPQVAIENDATCFAVAEARLGAGRKKRHVVGITIGTGIGGGIVIDGKAYRGAHGSAGHIGHILMDGTRDFEDLAAKRAFLKHGDRSVIVGRGVASAVNALDPDIVILGGGAVAERRIRFAAVRREARRHIVDFPPARRIPIVPAKLGAAAPAIGAALLAMQSPTALRKRKSRL